MREKSPTFETALKDFPEQLHTEIRQIAASGGVMSAASVRRACETLDIDIESLMLRLVPLAACYAVAPISRYLVGAVARGGRVDEGGYSQLYLGANMEFPRGALCYSLHAEQAAVASAWSNREPGVTSLAVSAPPCGHCRQFLYEVSSSNALQVVFPDGDKLRYRQTAIAELLPGAFGPADLGHSGEMMAVNSAPLPLELRAASLGLAPAEDDRLALEALAAARFSYAPYTENYSGCALQLRDGSMFSGSYAENAAHNPGLSPLHAALSNMRMALGPGALHGISARLARCVLVESAADISQQDLVTTLLSSLAPDISLEYYPARTTAE